MASVKQFCRLGHDTLACGRYKDGKCRDCCLARRKVLYRKNIVAAKARQREYYTKNGAAMLARKHKAVSELRAWADNFKTITGCVDCGYNGYPEALDFDHVGGSKKVNAVSRMILGLKSKDDIFAEIQKCQVVCSNCHRHRTKERGYVGCGLNQRAIKSV